MGGKRFWVVVLVALFSGVGIYAGVPDKVVYQGRLSRSGAAVSSSQNITVTLIDANGVESPQIVFSSLVTLAATGEFSVLLNMPPSYDWERAAPELEVQVGGEVLTPREKINVSPYAFLAKKVATGGVNAAAIQSGAVTDVNVSTISAAKIMLPGTASAMTVWQSTVAGQLDKIDSAKVYGTIPTVPAAHAPSHAQGGTDPIGIFPQQVTGRAIVSNTAGTQVLEAVSVATDTLSIKGMRGAQETSYYPLRVFGTQNPQLEKFNIRGDGQAYFDGNVGIGIPNPSAKLEVAGTIKDQWGFVVPPGTIVAFGGSTAPPGWLLCDGSSVSRATYANLFSTVGTSFGTGDGTTTFNLPDLRRRVIVGSGGTGTPVLGNRVGNAGGGETHLLTIPEMPSHDHNPGDGYVHLLKNDTNGTAQGTDASVGEPNIRSSRQIASAGGNQPHNNIQPSLILSCIIKF